MTLPELRKWATSPPSKTPAAMSVAGAVSELLKAQQRRHAEEFVPLASANADLVILRRHNAELQTELSRVRAETLPAAPWEETVPA